MIHAQIKQNDKLINRIAEIVDGDDILHWCKTINFKPSTLHDYINLTTSPRHSIHGRIKSSALALSDALYCIPEDLWDNEILYPDEITFTQLNVTHGNAIDAIDEHHSYHDPLEELIEECQSSAVNECLDNLKTREKEVIQLLYFDDLSLKETGAAFERSGQRASHIHEKALRKLRYYGRRTKLRFFSKDSLTIDMVDNQFSKPTNDAVWLAGKDRYETQMEVEGRLLLEKYRYSELHNFIRENTPRTFY